MSSPTHSAEGDQTPSAQSESSLASTPVQRIRAVNNPDSPRSPGLRLRAAPGSPMAGHDTTKVMVSVADTAGQYKHGSVAASDTFDDDQLTIQRKLLDYGTRTPLLTKFSIFAMLVFVVYLAATGWYLYIRVTYTLNMGSQTWYGIVIFAIECLGISAILPYATLLVLYTVPNPKTQGLPKDDGSSIPTRGFHVRVIVPCYKEGLDVVVGTVNAAMNADMPPGCLKTVYLCDDGNDAAKKSFVSHLGDKAVYVSGRTRAPGEINGKSANVNNCLRNVIYTQYQGHMQDLPWWEVVVVFDADMQAKPHFFLRMLEVLVDDKVALVLSPQAFSNINPAGDLFNNLNQQFWEYVLPGCDALGYIACTGTNFAVRARALARCGWFPEYCITEDYALSMELKRRGFVGRYLAEYLAVGEAPDEIRNVFRQRSRWTKGHMQVFFSWRTPLFDFKLSPLMQLYYTYGTWSYFTTILTTYTFLMVPFVSLAFGWHPVVFSQQFAIAATAYLGANWLVNNYVRKPAHLRGLWMAQVSNVLLCFTYFKAVINTVMSKMGFKDKAGFKATEKKGIGKQLRAAFSRRFQAGGSQAGSNGPSRTGSGDLPVAQAPQRPGGQETNSRCCAVGDLQGILDPLALGVYLLICLACIAMGIYQVVWGQQLQVYLLLPMLWASYNAVPAILFFLYMAHRGRFLHFMASFMHLIQVLLGLAALASLWMLIPAQTDLTQVVPATMTLFDLQRAGPLPSALKAAFPFLEDSGLTDPVVGGWYMGADYVKYSLPTAATVTALAWTALSFPEGLAKANAMAPVQAQIRIGANYLLGCHVKPDVFIAQIGRQADYIVNASAEAGFWGLPSDMPPNRKADYIFTTSKGGAEVVAAAAAALASSSLVLRASDPGWAANALVRARQLYSFATQMVPALPDLPKPYCYIIDCSGGDFTSDSVFDDLAHAAAWLYKATGERAFSDDAEFFLLAHDNHEAKPEEPGYYVANFNNVAWGTAALLADSTGSRDYANRVRVFTRYWMKGQKAAVQVVLYTPQGLAWTYGAPLPNTAAASFLSLLFAKSPSSGLTPAVRNYVQCWARAQLAYIVGDAGGKYEQAFLAALGQKSQDARSYVVGWGDNFPSQPYHRFSSCPPADDCNIRSALVTQRPNPWILEGALVAGPDPKDQFPDLRMDNGSRISTVWNAPLLGAMAGLLDARVDAVQCMSQRGLFQLLFQPTTP